MRPDRYPEKNSRKTIFWGVMVVAIAWAFGLLPSTTNAQCAQWDVSGQWDAKLSTGAAVRFNVKQSGNDVSATASYVGLAGGGVDAHNKVTGNKFGFVLVWDAHDTITGGHTEWYVGTIAPDGTVTGTARVFGYLSKDTTWTASRPMRCAQRIVTTGHPGPASTTTPPKTIKVTGHPRADPTPPPATPATVATAPRITALPNNINLRGQPQGTTKIIWDGGKDHPYAEVWVKVDAADERKVIEKGQGSLQVTVEKGKTYIYNLEDSGVTLATVTVRFH